MWLKNFIHILKTKNVFRELIVYFLGCGTTIQLMQWMTNNFLWSPHLPTLTFTVLASLFPSVLLYSYYHGNEAWSKIERVGIPFNIIVTVILVFTLFHSKDLGAITEKIETKDEFGNIIKREIPKQNHRESVLIFFFDNETGDSTLNYLQYAFSYGCSFDLNQNAFFNIGEPYYFLSYELLNKGYKDGVNVPFSLKRKIALDAQFPYFITGDIKKDTHTLSVHIAIYNSKTAQLITENDFLYTNIFSMIDEISDQIKIDFELPKKIIEETTDLPASSIFTESEKAFEYYINGLNYWHLRSNVKKAEIEFDKAIILDSTFALVHMDIWKLLLMRNAEKGSFHVQKAMDYNYKIPERFRFLLKYYYTWLEKKNEQQAISVLKMYIDLYPDDIQPHVQLGRHYRGNGEHDKAILEFEKILEMDSTSAEHILSIGEVYQANYNYTKALQYYQKYEKINLDVATRSIAKLYKVMGDFENANNYYQKILLENPRNISVLIDLADIERKTGNCNSALEQGHELLRMCVTNQDSIDVYFLLTDLYVHQGMIEKAKELIFNSKKTLTKGRTFYNFDCFLIDPLLDMGNIEAVLKIIKKFREKTSGLFDYFQKDIISTLMYLHSSITKEYIDDITRCAQTLTKEFKRFGLQDQIEIFLLQAKVATLSNEYQKAINILEENKNRPLNFTLNPEIYCHTLLAENYLMLKEFVKVEENFNVILQKHPKGFEPPKQFPVYTLSKRAP